MRHHVANERTKKMHILAARNENHNAMHFISQKMTGTNYTQINKVKQQKKK